MAADAPPLAPMVFQCMGCFSIVGDSWSILQTPEEELGSIILEKVVNLAKSEDQLDEENHSIFTFLHCENCGKIVGKSYITPPPSIHHLAGMAIVTIDSVQSYSLGDLFSTEVKDLSTHTPADDPIINNSNQNLNTNAINLEFKKLRTVCKVYGTKLAGHDEEFKRLNLKLLEMSEQLSAAASSSSSSSLSTSTLNGKSPRPPPVLAHPQASISGSGSTTKRGRS